jgi:hypothetical protein
MPNWCENNLNIIGSKEDIDRLVEHVKNDDKPLSFNSILPMPKDLVGTRSPAYIVTQEEYDNITPEEWAKMDDPNNPFESKPITEEISNRYMRLYGSNNWYDWACYSWGTKWDTRDVGVIRWDDTGISYEFDTAWCPPEGIYKELVSKFPKLEFELQWSEEGGDSGMMFDPPATESEVKDNA